jgi:hypothetical protein
MASAQGDVPVDTQVSTGQPTLPAVAGFIGQATAVEQARAVAEVQSAIVVAQQVPRDMNQAVATMRESMSQKAMAERAFYRFSRGGGPVTGPTIHMARELARCWGNVQYGIAELRRDDDKGESEMLAFAWDVQTNTRNAHTFIVPHKRDKRGGPEKLTDLRDIYENNANQGSRRVREAILAILPPWYVEEAKDRAANALADGGDVPLPKRIADAVAMYDGLGISADRLEQHVGRPRTKWSDHDIAQLGITYRSLQRGEIRADEEFPPKRVTAREIEGGDK